MWFKRRRYRVYAVKPDLWNVERYVGFALSWEPDPLIYDPKSNRLENGRYFRTKEEAIEAVELHKKYEKTLLELAKEKSELRRKTTTYV